MKPITTIFAITLISIIVAYGTVKITMPNNAATTKQESVFDRVIRTGTLTCGYLVWPPFFDKDANTGKLSGVIYDVTESIAKNLSLKVNWKEETGISDFPAALTNNRIDMYCAPIGVLAARARASDWAGPVIYGTVKGYVRPDDTRFDTDRSKLNDPLVTFSTLDGEASDVLSRTLFPDAKKLQLQQLAASTQLMLNVVDKKADIVLADFATAGTFEKSNPGALKPLPGPPIGTFGIGMPVKQGEEKFRQMINWAIFDMQNNGQMEMIFKKYDLQPDIWLRPAQSYAFGDKK
jgi:ABC-type amino acid transport substrate-binding protein